MTCCWWTALACLYLCCVSMSAVCDLHQGAGSPVAGCGEPRGEMEPCPKKMGENGWMSDNNLMWHCVLPNMPKWITAGMCDLLRKKYWRSTYAALWWCSCSSLLRDNVTGWILSSGMKEFCSLQLLLVYTWFTTRNVRVTNYSKGGGGRCGDVCGDYRMFLTHLTHKQLRDVSR